MPANEIETLTARLKADLAEFERGMRGATMAADRAARSIQQRFDRLGQQLQTVGRRLSVALTAPITAASALAARAYDEQVQAERQLAVAIQSTGGDAEATLAVYKEYAAALQRITTVGDEATLANLQVAKSMGLTDRQAARAAKNAIALSAAFNINERAAIRYTAGLEQGDTTMLNRYIPTLRLLEDETARAAEAQRILGDAFQVAVVQAQVGLGPWKQLRNAVGDLSEGFGELVLAGVNPFIVKAKALVERFQQLEPQTRKSILTWGAFAAAVGPATLAVGLLARAVGFAATGLVAFVRIVGVSLIFTLRRLLPVLLTAGTAVAIVAAVSEDARKKMLGLWDQLQKLMSGTNLTKGFEELVQALTGTSINVSDVATRIDELIGKLTNLGQGGKAAAGGMNELEAAVRTVREELEKEGDAIRESVMTPLERYEATHDRLASLLRQGAIDHETYIRALRAARVELRGTEEQGKKTGSVMRDLGATFSSAFENAVVAGNDLRSVLQGLWQDLMRIFTRKMISEPLFGALFGDDDNGGLLGGLFGSAHGNAFTGPIVPFARGGALVSGPTAFPMAAGVGVAGERGPEAIFPIVRTRGGDLGVRATGGGMDLNVRVENNTSATASARRAPNGDLLIMLDQANEVLFNRSGSRSSRALRDGFGLRRATVTR